MKNIIVCISIFCVISLVACSQDTAKEASGDWPTDEWKVSTPEEQGMDSGKLVEMYEHIDKDNQGQLHGLVVVRNGHIVAENYNSPYDQSSEHNIKSVTKSLLGSVVGVAIEDDVINLDDRILDYFPDMEFENRSDEKKEMTIEQFLTMTSGMEWKEWENAMMMFLNWNKSDNQLQYYLNQPVKEEQIGTFNYDTGSAHVLGTIIENETGMRLQDYAAENIFDKIGVDSLEWGEANEGSTMGGTDSEMTPRDMARFGYLYLHEGKWDGEQIIPKDWVEASLTKHTDTGQGNDSYYGYYFWVLEDEGHDLYMAMGYDNQFIMIVPDSDLVVVQTSDRYDFYTLLYDYIIPSIESDKAIDENEEAYKELKEWME